MFEVFDFWLIALIMLGLGREGRSPWWAGLYAFHPLAITEFAAAGHQDVIGIAWLMMALMLVDERGLFGPTEFRGRGRRRLRAMLAGGAFALAVGVKPIVLPLALPLAWAKRREPDELACAVAGTMMTLAALYGPFMFMPGGLDGMVETARYFAWNWTFNSSFYVPLKHIVIARPIAAAICAAIIGSVMIVQVRRQCDMWVVAMTYLFVSLLVSSTCHPWYLLWALAFLPLRPDAFVAGALWMWSLTIGWSYVALVDPASYTVSWQVMLLEYVPVYGVLACAAWWNGRGRGRDSAQGMAR